MKNKFTTSSIYKEANWWDEAKEIAGDVADATVGAFEDAGMAAARAAHTAKEFNWDTVDADDVAAATVGAAGAFGNALTYPTIQAPLKRVGEGYQHMYDLGKGIISGDMDKAKKNIMERHNEEFRPAGEVVDDYVDGKFNFTKNNADDVVFVEDMENMQDSGTMEELMSLVESVFDESALEVNPEASHMDEDLSAEEVLNNVAETLDEAGDLADEFEEFAKKIPGSDMFEDEMEDEEPKETNYLDDGDLSKFLDHVKELYPAKIPQHDGKSMLGCERAISWLDRLNSEISKNIRMDTDNVLDIHELEQIRVRIMSDVLALKSHLGKLKKKFKESNNKTASVDNSGVPSWTDASGNEISYDQLTKEASTPRKMVVAVSPFERAISGILINAHVSGGHPMEEVYGFLSEKYSIEPREELSIMQVCMDSGFPIFKDRGTYSGNDNKEESRKGVDFIKNYFA